MAAAKARIEALPWVDTAAVTRILPNRLAVALTERAPAALWRDGARSLLLDRTGRLLATVPPDVMLELPRLAGAAAPAEAQVLLDLLDLHADLRRTLSVAERVGERRWTLHLASGLAVHLAAGREAAGIRLYEALEAKGLDKAVSALDLRVPGRIGVRRQGPGQLRLSMSRHPGSASDPWPR
jgi:cell division protein FtsQ